MPLFGIDRMLSTDQTRFCSPSDTISWKEEYALFERGMREFRSLTEVFKSTVCRINRISNLRLSQTRFASLLGDAMSASELLVAYKLSSRLCEKIVEKIANKSTGTQSKNTTINLDDQTNPRNAKIKNSMNTSRPSKGYYRVSSRINNFSIPPSQLSYFGSSLTENLVSCQVYTVLPDRPCTSDIFTDNRKSFESVTISVSSWLLRNHGLRYASQVKSCKREVRTPERRNPSKYEISDQVRAKTIAVFNWLPDSNGGPLSLSDGAPGLGKTSSQSCGDSWQSALVFWLHVHIYRSIGRQVVRHGDTQPADWLIRKLRSELGSYKAAQNAAFEVPFFASTRMIESDRDTQVDLTSNRSLSVLLITPNWPNLAINMTVRVNHAGTQQVRVDCEVFHRILVFLKVCKPFSFQKLSKEEEPILNAMQKENCPPADPSQKKSRREIPAKVSDNPGQDLENTAEMNGPNTLYCKLEDPEKLDNYIRQSIRGWLRLPKDTPISYIHAGKQHGGLGIPSLSATIPMQRRVRMEKLLSTQCRVLRNVVNDSAFGKIVRDLSFPIRVHGSYVNTKEELVAAWGDSLHNIVDGRGLRELKVFPRTRVRSARLGHGGQTILCRGNCGQPESLVHILQFCWITHDARCARHNRVARELAKRLRHLGYTVFEVLRAPTSTSFIKPDLIAVRERRATVIDVIVSDGRGVTVWNEKKQKYGADEFSLALISALRAIGCDMGFLVHQPMIISYRGICFLQSAKAVIGLGLSKVTVSDLCLLPIVGSLRTYDTFMRGTWR
ncbi:retrovirus-related Pol polyprotein from type-1 retrotransposable element R2 [Clonorchis sinensis]|uniref:Retrovirus-related Pol polyprotein from type-1 retrotransposable element R2 n=1 Tax=Clonorchis sinensis TaxID=79923 RepID=G7YQC6_CLOSI|nr:retrovirus-related Pol polyprotein from type-1 retrotransposable element R2 [Clonorchis sinensis]